jgi:hypothetical protein
MKIKENLSSIAASSNKTSQSSSFKLQVGKVYAVIQNETTPSADAFNQYGGWDGLGSVFYLNYDNARNIDTIDLAKCKVAKPLFPNSKNIPLIGELVLVFDLPSYSTQVYQNNVQTYYVTSINIWNNNHHNSQPATDTVRLGKSFTEDPLIQSLYPFEGDHILEGRNGNSIRFGSTTTYYSNVNPWSSSGNNGDPITIISNGHKYIANSTVPYIENINTDAASIYFTSTQTIPLIPDVITLNKLTNPIAVNKYNNSQILQNANRIVLNSNLDEILLFSKTNIELYTKNIVNVNAGNRVHLNSSKVFLGANIDSSLPTEPLLLGNQTVMLLNNFFLELSKFCAGLGSAITPSEGTPLMDVNVSAQQLNTKLQTFLLQLKTIYSTVSFTK